MTTELKLKLPTRAELMARLGGPPQEWAGSCHGASLAVVNAMEQMGHEVGYRGVAMVRRGYFAGDIAPGAYFDGRPSQHSWVELLTEPPDRRVCDPTRFAFTNEPPWPLWVGPEDDYDIGGCKMAAPKPPAPDIYETEGEMRELELGSVEYVADLLGTPPDFYGGEEDDRWITISPEQAAWLANLPVKDGEQRGTLSRMFAAEVYEALIKAGYSGLIPIDRRDWIVPDLDPEKAGLR